MSKRFRKMLAFLCCLVMTTSLMPVSFAAENDNIEYAEANETPTALFGTPELGSNDPLWSQTKKYPINKSTIPGDSRPHATGTAQILWDNEYLYSRVVVEDSNVYQGSGPNHTYDSLEFYVGPGSSGSNQWRVSTTGVFSGQSDTNRAAWTKFTDTGYIVEMRIPKRNLTLQPGKLTFEVYINNSSEIGGDRYEVVSAFGDPDTGFNSDAAFTDSLELIEASELDDRHSITLLTDTGGQIMPNAPGNVLRVTPGSEKTFTLIPNNGKIVDNVTVNGESATISSDNTFSVTDIQTDLNIHATFKDDSAADQLPFIVWNDNFARGEYTTAVIIDLGEGKEAVGSELHPGLFTISARDTTFSGDSVVFEGTRKITRVYANNEPKVRGYLGKIHNSPDYQDGLESGRYIVAELEFFTEVGGNTTLDGSNSTKQNYNIIQKDTIKLTEGDSLNYTVFKQQNVVNPILDKFTPHTSNSVNYALYLHKDKDGKELQKMPLYVYTHGFSRGGTQAHIDQKASMKSANGSVALMKKMESNPEQYASHILNISYSDGSAPQVSNIKAIIDDMVASGLVDPNRIYASGFSMGGGVTSNLINTYPGFFAAAAPLGISSGWPVASKNEAHKDLAYWLFVNTYDSGASNVDNISKDISDLTNTRASRFDSNEALTWPYNQYDQPSQRPNLENDPPLLRYIAHEVEAAVLYNEITMENPFTKTTWSMAPIAQSPNLPSWDNDYTDVFDWMFSQSKQMVLPDAPTASYGTPELGSNDPLWSKTKEYPINKSTVPGDSRPHATGTARILWDNDYLYSRVVVQDSNVYQGPGGDHTYDSLEFYVGPGSNGSNQWRVSSTGIYSGQSHTDRAAWTQITETGYIVEMRIPKRDLILEPGKFTFDIYINNSSEKGADRYEVVSAFGDPDTGYGSDAAFRDSLRLIEADEVDTRFSISIQADTGGNISPNAPGNVLRMEKGEDITFTITPNQGNIVDTVTVDGKAVNISSDNTFSLTNISADHEIRVTFKDDPAADQLPFIIWNDNFASGEYTTAVIIDLGEGNEALGSKLQAGLFNVSAKNTTLVGDQLVFEGTRKISRVYANDEPKVRGYVGKVSNSPDYQAGLDSGRYIVIELEFYTEAGGRTTLDGTSNSTKQNYNIVQKGDIVLTKGDSLNNAVFKQTNVVNPILDKFTTHTNDSFNYALYLHEDGKGEVLQGMPLYVYTHGMSRGGTQSKIDQKASMKSANGSVALMKNMEKDPSKYASHILNISYNGTSTPKTDDVKKVIDNLVAEGLVDPNRIYVAGFSWGGAYTNTLINTYPGFFAAGAPMAPVFGSPEASVNEAHKDLAYWIFVNAHNVGGYQTNLNNFISNNMPKMTNARASRFESNEALTWPYNQFDQPNQRPNPNNNPPLPDYIAHEVEAAVLYNQITMGNWSIAPIAQSSNLSSWNNDYTDVFDWMFSQRKPGVPDAPSSFTAAAGDKQVTLKWTAPANDGGSAISGYKVWYGDKTPITVDKSTYEYTFTGLTNDQEYTFKIVAVSSKGDSAEKSVTAKPKQTSNPNPNPNPSPTPTPTPTPSNPTVPKPSGDNTSNTGTGADTGSSKPTYTLNTPKDKPAVTDKNGITTLPGGGEIVTKSGTKIEVPKGTTIDSKGKVVIGSAGASVGLDNGVSLNIQKGTELVLNDDTALGFNVVSGNPFNDVHNGNWFYSHVNFAYTFNLFNGTTSTTFSPETAMTRAMFVQALANLENVNRSGSASSRFNDVPKDQWYTAAVEWAAEKGIVSGINADQFKPDSTVSREQMLVILYNFMKYKGFEITQSQSTSFTDESEISSWALEAVQALQGIGIVSGKPGNLFDHNANATRAEVATIFARFIEYLAK